MSAEYDEAEFGAGPPAGLNTRVRSGLRWSLASTIARRLLTPVLGVVLAHLLTPQEFGVFVVATVALGALTSMNDLGVTMTIVRWPGELEQVPRTATTVAVGVSAALYALCFFAAPWFAAELHTPQAVGVLRLLALCVVIDGIGSVPIGYLIRRFRQKQRAAADWAGLLVSMIVTITLAANGFGAWSLAWGRLAGNVVTVGMVYALLGQRPPRPGWNRAIAVKIARFGLPLTGASLLVFATLNVDYVLVGNRLGTVALGLYVLAFNVSSFPVNIVSEPVRQVSIPAFAEMQDDRDALGAAFVRSLHILVATVAPLCALLFTLALPLVVFVYGPPWRQASAALAFLAILCGFRVVYDFAYNLLVAVGRSKTLFWLQALWLAALVVALSIGAEAGGIRGVAIGHVVVAALVMAPAFLFALRPERISRMALIRALVRPILGAALASVAGAITLRLVGAGIEGLAAGAFAILAVYAVAGVSFAELRMLPRGIIGRNPALV